MGYAPVNNKQKVYIAKSEYHISFVLGLYQKMSGEIEI